MTSIANMMLRSFGTYIMIMSMVDMMMKMILKNDDHLHSLAFSCHNVRDDPDNTKREIIIWNIENDLQ